MRLRFAGVILLIICVTEPAAAASITNRDDKDYKLTIGEGGAKSAQTLKAGGVIDGICLKGCVVRIGDSPDDEYELDGSDLVSIEDGLLFSDSPDLRSPAAPGTKVPGSRP